MASKASLEEAAVLYDASEDQPRHSANSLELQSLVDRGSSSSDDDQQPVFFSRPSDMFDIDDATLFPLSLTEMNRRPTHLQKEVGFLTGLTLVVGVMIGSGIFASPGPVALHAGSVGMSLVTWVICGLLAWTGALSYAELGTEIPISGGEHAYLNYAYGSLPAFLFSWTAITCMKPGANAITLMILAEYVNRIIYHAIFDDVSEHPTHQWFNKIVAILCAIVISVINAYGVRLGMSTQNVFTAVKLIALLAIAVIGFVVLGRGGLSSNFKGDIFADTSTSFGDHALAFYSGLWAYDGWNNLNIVAGEMKNPARDLPRVIFIGVPVVTASYVLANIAYYAVLPASVVKQTNTIALDFGRATFSTVGGTMFALCVIFSCFGAVNGSMFTGCRIIHVAGREGYLPAVFGEVHPKWHTPTAALILQGVLTIAMIIPGTFVTLINFYSVAAWVFYSLTTFSLLVLRWREPDLPRPYKVWISTPIIFCCVAIFLLVMPFIQVPLESLAALAFILAGVPFWYLSVMNRDLSIVKRIKNVLSNVRTSFGTLWRLRPQGGYQRQETVELS